MTQGMAFGELALLTDSNRRSSIIAMDNLLLACLKKPIFTRIIVQANAKNVHDTTNFLKYIPIFKDFSIMDIRKYALNFNKMSFKKSENVFREDFPANFV